MAYGTKSVPGPSRGELSSGPVGDHPLCTMLNDLRIRERVMRDHRKPQTAVTWENVYGNLLGSSGRRFKWRRTQRRTLGRSQ
jgi:hypothetical protein